MSSCEGWYKYISDEESSYPNEYWERQVHHALCDLLLLPKHFLSLSNPLDILRHICKLIPLQVSTAMRERI